MTQAIEALYIYDEHNLIHSNLLFLLTSSHEIEPLLALEFLHRIVDVFEEFIGAPLLAHKVESNYDVAAQLLNEMCDAGAVSTTEPNALRDLVEVEGWVGKLLGGITIPGKAGFASAPSSSNMSAISSTGTLATNTPALPWRRANVRHTSNELYVDIVETLSVTLAPSGRPLAAFANGTIAFTSKISGVPDLLVNLSTPSGKHNLDSVMELPVFHPCVRLARWRENPGELSFVPPDGRFVLAGYEVNLLPSHGDKAGNTSSSSLKLPAQVEVKTSLGPTGSEFEVRLFITKVSGQGNSSASGPSQRGAGHLGGRAGSGFGGGIGMNSGSSPTSALDDLVVTIPLPDDVRNLSEIRASRGDTTYSPGGKTLEWHIPTKEATPGGASLRCTVAGPLTDDGDFEGNGFRLDGRYDYDEDAYQSTPVHAQKASEKTDEGTDAYKVAQNKILMPSSASVSFSTKGWLASGIKVESVTVDTRKSRGLGEGVKPYKGVKYLTISRSGIEVRC